MPATTPKRGYDYPLATDPVASTPATVQSFASDVDTDVDTLMKPLAAWAAWFPTFTSGVGALTTVTTGHARYIEDGKSVHWSMRVTITNAGTAGAGFNFTLPVPARTTGVAIGSGREDVGTGHMLQVMATSTTVGFVIKYDNTTAIATGHVFTLSGTYERA